MITVECPDCWAEVALDGRQSTVVCSDCGTLWLVEYDADMRNGLWQDCSRLVRPKNVTQVTPARHCFHCGADDLAPESACRLCGTPFAEPKRVA